MNKNSNNDLLLLGVGILIIGLVLTGYSISTYVEIKNLSEKVDFEMIDNNHKLSTMDKYYEYLSISEFLSKKLNQNKNIPVKNSACVYLDYAQHNAIELYRLTDRKLIFDDTKKNVAVSNIRNLYNIYDNYKTCKQASGFKSELGAIIEDIQNINNDNNDSEDRMNNFLNGYRERKLEEESLLQHEYNEDLTEDELRQIENQVQQQYAKTPVQIPKDVENINESSEESVQ